MNQRLETLGKSGAYNVKGGTTAEAALAAVAGMASVDVILANEKSAEQIDRLLSQIRGNVRVERAGLLVIVTSKVASSYAAIAQNDSLVTVTDAKDDAGLAASIEEARKRSGGLPLDEKLATEYALRSAELLTKLAISRGQVLDLSVAQNALLAAMDDARPEIAKAAGNVLALFPSKDVQMAIAAKVLEEKTADELRASFLKSLSTSAKFYGNQLEAAQTEALTKLVEIGATMDVRSAAAEAHGALNLPPDRVKRLIMSQAKK